MSEARSITNTIGNVVVARWVCAVDRSRMQRILDGEELDRNAVAAPQPVEGRDEVRGEVVVGLGQHQNVSA